MIKRELREPVAKFDIIPNKEKEKGAFALQINWSKSVVCL